MFIGVHGNAYTLNLPSAMATHPTFYVGMLKGYLDPSAEVETDATCGSSSGEGRQSVAPLERLSEPEEQVSLEGKQDTPRDTQIVPKRVQEPGLSSPSVAQGSSPGSPGSSSIDTDHPALSASSQPTTRLARSVVPGDAVGGLGTPHAVADDDHPNGHGCREPGRGPSAQTARVGTLPNDPGNGSRNYEGSVTPQTDEKNRGGMIRPPQPLLGRDGERYFLVERVVGNRRKAGRQEFWVKWSGYPMSHNTWEPEDRLVEDCADHVGAYKRDHSIGPR
uniref:Chromo domain-containing protein n=1 Tax=Hyaloperonospora arabidopsidis (strain Emoy2) TaxID=559515 RepID=M4BX69_HYAAE